MKRIRIKHLPGYLGWFNPNNGQITLSTVLKSKPIESKRFVLEHELAHSWLEKKKIKFSRAKEELICDLFALAKCQGKELSLLQSFLKKLFIKNYGQLSKRKILKMDLSNLF